MWSGDMVRGAIEWSGSHSCPDRQESMISCQDSPVALLVVQTQANTQTASN